MIAIVMLMYIISLELQLSPCVNILNLCSNTKLVSSVYFGDNVVCSRLSERQIDIDAKMSVNLEINAIQDDFECALLFKLQRYSNWYNTDTLTTETNRNKTTHAYMLVAWKVKESTHFVRVALVEHIKEFAWNEEELRKLYDENRGWLKKCDNNASHTWLMDDGVILKTSFKVIGSEENFELRISISEEEKDDYAMRPFCINFER
jgi:hypothetical protein